MRHLPFHVIGTATVFVAMAGAALADISGSATLAAGSGLNLDTGATTTGAGGDIVFTGTSITFQGTAKGANLGNVGSAGFGALNQAALQALAAAASTTPIPASALVVGDVFGVATNGGHAAKVLVNAVSGTSITLQYTTYGATGSTSGGPAITGIANNYSYIPSGFPNSGVSPSSIFVVFGSGMAAAPSGTVTLQSSAGPAGLPQSLNGTSLSVTVGGTTVTPAIYYALPTAIAAVLPAGTPTGTATLTVTYNSTVSNAFTFQVAPVALGLDTYYGTGGGLAVATNAGTGALFNATNSVSPGETIVLWGSGLGADTQDSDTVFTTTPHPVNQGQTQIYFGGVPGTVLYAGSSGYPGLNQINVTVPTSAPTGCGISVAAVVNGVTSNFTTLPLAQGGGTCTDTAFGVTGSQIMSLSGQSTVKTGDLIVGQSVTQTETSNFASAMFQSVTGLSYGASTGIVSIGSCIVHETVSGATATTTPLDAGNISVTVPGGASYSLTTVSKGVFDALLPSGAITPAGGTYTFAGTGGADVGAFLAAVTLPNPLLTWTNSSSAATVTRAQGLPVTWTGGASGSYVIISGDSAGNGVSGSYLCYAPQSALQFTVPAYVTGTLPAGTGNTSVENATDFSLFTAPGLDFGIGFGFTSASVTSTYQ